MPHQVRQWLFFTNMSYSSLSICNGALQKIGMKRIMSLSDDTTEGKACNAEYDKVRKFILRLYPWGFAIKRVILAPAPTAPEFEFSYRLPLPSDFMRLVDLYEYDGRYRLEGTAILADADSLNLRYVADVSDFTKADSLFVEAFEWYLGYTLARYLTESDSVRQEAMQGFKGVMPLAKFVQSTEQSQPEVEAFDLIESRFNYRGFVRDPGT